MDYSVELPELKSLLSALDKIANSTDFSARVVNPPVRKALGRLQRAIAQNAPRQSAKKAARMRRYPRYAKFALLRERIGMKFKGATKKKLATGKAGSNVGFKRNNQAPQGPWVYAGTKLRQTKAKRNRGLIPNRHLLQKAIQPIVSSVEADLRAETRANYLREASAESGSPLRKG